MTESYYYYHYKMHGVRSKLWPNLVEECVVVW